MVDITIVGLGPGPSEFRTLAVQSALESTKRIFVRSHPNLDLDGLLSQPDVTDLEQFHDMDAPDGRRWKAAAEAVCDAASSGPVVLAIPGHPRFGEGLTSEAIQLAADRGLSIRVLDGISVTDLMSSALNIDPIGHRIQLIIGRKLIALDNLAPFDGGMLRITPSLPVFITHVYDNKIMAAVTAQLSRIFPQDHRVELISHAGAKQQTRELTTVAALVEHQGGPMLAVYVPAFGELDATRDPATLQHIVARLRRPDGCPWDRKQDNTSMAQSLIDEVYEVIDAIESGDDANLAEELGDLLLLIMMHTQIAEERDAFTLEDVYEGIATKIVRRHPHVFGELAAASAEEVVGLWQQVKAQEKADSTGKPEKAADGEPHSMPALTRAPRVLKNYPVEVGETTAEQRQQALFDAVSAIVVAGDDPDEILKLALKKHVEDANEGTEQGESNASN